MSSQGTITKWKDESGFGFITPAGGGEEIFVHINSFLSRERRPVANDDVVYELGHDSRGRACALQVKIAGDPVAGSALMNALYLPTLFLFLVAGLVVSGKLRRETLALYLGASILTFFIYGADKSAAAAGRWRVPEKILHSFSVIGGWPGAYFAQRYFRHKSQKLSFQFGFWVTVATNCLALCWVLKNSL